MKYLTHILVAGIVITTIAAGFVFFAHTSIAPSPVACTEEAKLCPDGSSVGRTGPNCEFAPCPNTQPTTSFVEDIRTQLNTKADFIIIDTASVLNYKPIVSPITITGKARGTWYFEASFPIVIVDWDGRIIGEGYAEAQSDWMTEDFVPFKATVTFDLPKDTPYTRGAIILKKDNPSGLPEHDDALEIPVTFSELLE